YFFFFQAEDGIRDSSVTGVQTCALPISKRSRYEQSLSTAREPNHPAVLRETRRQTAAGLVTVDAGIDSQRHAHFQYPSNGRRIRSEERRVGKECRSRTARGREVGKKIEV